MRNTSTIFSLDLDGCDFEKLPKGDFFQLAMNPYTGKVFMKLGKNELSGSFAYSVLKDLMRACASLEAGGCADPLGKVSALTLQEIGELSKERKVAEIKVMQFGMKRKAV